MMHSMDTRPRNWNTRSSSEVAQMWPAAMELPPEKYFGIFTIFVSLTFQD